MGFVLMGLVLMRFGLVAAAAVTVMMTFGRVLMDVPVTVIPPGSSVLADRC